ncbi:hypothetical protein Moror_2908 [Moniliophthora roreri MCA 2997]|uniref:Uncharacterized protein n=1 Tax=Moniliophthora roreri (strain MCA 2997) TaxID=1381753 RepID=V2WWH7_MONRO|nr:hypothetical protein Moror_2908 [Moniliophthora roreri MCA 2997]
MDDMRQLRFNAISKSLLDVGLEHCGVPSAFLDRRITLLAPARDPDLRERFTTFCTISTSSKRCPAWLSQIASILRNEAGDKVDDFMVVPRIILSIGSIPGS